MPSKQAVSKSSGHDYSNIPTDLLIGGRWIAGSGGKRIDVLDPASERRLASVADATEDDAIKAIDAAHAAAASWAATAPRKRGEILRKAFELMAKRVDWFAELIALENGKSLGDAKSEVVYAAEFFRWYSEEAVRISGEIGIAPGGTNRMLVIQQPIGVSLLITPWNFPAAMATRKIGPALAAGCTCILKPATETPLTAFAMASLLKEAGLPDGVLNVLTTSKSGDVVAAMMNDPRLRKLSFTGSTEVGRTLLKQASARIINCSMELGGNAPFIVFDDADLSAALDGAMIAKIRNGGEACTAANRFYAQRGIADAFAEQLAARMAKLRVGKGTDPDTALGPLVNAATRDKVVRLVADARDRGAKVLTGGKTIDRPGYFYEATVLTNIAPGSKLLKEEIFGPVAPIVTFDRG